MGIDNIPSSYEAMEAYLHQFEHKRMIYAKSNVEVLRPTIDFNLSTCPKILRPLFRQLLAAMCHATMRKALDMPPPSRFAIGLLHIILYTRGFIEEYLLPPRRKRLHRTPLDGNAADSQRVRPAFRPATACPYRTVGYRIGELGPPGLLKDAEFGRALATK